MREILATQRGKSSLWTSTDKGRTGIRPDQRSTWYSQIPLTRPVERDIRVEAHLRTHNLLKLFRHRNDFGSRLTTLDRTTCSVIASTAHTLVKGS